MDTFEFVNNPIFDFPIKTKSCFPTHLSNIFDTYLNLITSLDDENAAIVSKHIDVIKKSCDQILSITRHYFEGKLSKSYLEFSELVSRLSEHLVQKDKNVVISNQDSHLFKARSKLDKDYSINDMFHVPFDQRYTIKTSRFSISGLPCLYLSNSIYTCWEELGRPPFAQMAVSRFETYRKNFKYLDLSVNLWSLQLIFRKDVFDSVPDKEIGILQLFKEQAFEKFLLLYPLYVACYTVVANKTADFKPEYIFPQMLMEWIVNSDWIDGVIYEPTKTARLKRIGGVPNLKELLNYAIPVKSNSENGFCSEMVEKLKLTKPNSWELINILNPEIVSAKIDYDQLIKKMAGPPIIWFELDGKRVRYHETAFGRFESYLFEQPLHSLAPAIATQA